MTPKLDTVARKVRQATKKVAKSIVPIAREFIGIALSNRAQNAIVVARFLKDTSRKVESAANQGSDVALHLATSFMSGSHMVNIARVNAVAMIAYLATKAEGESQVISTAVDDALISSTNVVGGTRRALASFHKTPLNIKAVNAYCASQASELSPEHYALFVIQCSLSDTGNDLDRAIEEMVSEYFALEKEHYKSLHSTYVQSEVIPSQAESLRNQIALNAAGERLHHVFNSLKSHDFRPFLHALAKDIGMDLEKVVSRIPSSGSDEAKDRFKQILHEAIDVFKEDIQKIQEEHISDPEGYHEKLLDMAEKLIEDVKNKIETQLVENGPDVDKQATFRK